MTTWLITGANRGIGLEFARQLSARGDRVIGTARNPADDASDLRALEARILQLDVADPGSVEAFGRALDEPVDALINNAGRGGGGPGIDELDFDIVAEFFQVNSIGPMRVAQAALPALREGAGKRILAISSKLGSIEDNTSGTHYPYRASKAALNMLHKNLAIELADEGFVCAVLHPGWVRTRLGGPKARLTPADSVAGMLAVVDRLGPEDNGAFYGHDGERVPW